MHHALVISLFSKTQRKWIKNYLECLIKRMKKNIISLTENHSKKIIFYV